MRRMAKASTKRLLCCFLLLLLLPGCVVSSPQINDLAIVTAVGIDSGDEPGEVRVTAQIVRAADARGQTGAPSGGIGQPIHSIAAEGRTIFEAIRNMARFSTRRIYWAHNFVIVMNDDYAKDGIADMIDFFTRNHQLRMRTWVLVTPDSASELVSTITGLEIIPGEGIDKLFRYNRIVAEAPRTNMMRLQEAFLNESTHPVIAKAELKGRGIPNKRPEQLGAIDQVELSGTAVFRGDKFIGYLSPSKSRSLLYFIEKVESAIYTLPCPTAASGNNIYASFEMVGNRFSVEPAMENGKPSFRVRLSADFNFVETGCRMPLQRMMPAIEEQLEEQIEKEFGEFYRAVQEEYKVDVMKLGEVVHNRYPAQWNDIKERWKDLFPTVDIATQVDVNIRSTVLKVRSPIPEKGEDE